MCEGAPRTAGCNTKPVCILCTFSKFTPSERLSLKFILTLLCHLHLNVTSDIFLLLRFYDQNFVSKHAIYTLQDFPPLPVSFLIIEIKGANSFLRNRQSLNSSGNSMPFYVTRQCITEFTRACYWTPSEPSESRPTHSFKTHFSIILPSPPRSPKWSLPLKSSD
jgi:hypothetical protein